MTLEEFEKIVVEFNVPQDQTGAVLHNLNRCGEIVYLGDKEKNSALADISISFSFLSFLYIFIYHFYLSFLFIIF